MRLHACHRLFFHLFLILSCGSFGASFASASSPDTLQQYLPSSASVILSVRPDALSKMTSIVPSQVQAAPVFAKGLTNGQRACMLLHMSLNRGFVYLKRNKLSKQVMKECVASLAMKRRSYYVPYASKYTNVRRLVKDGVVDYMWLSKAAYDRKSHSLARGLLDVSYRSWLVATKRGQTKKMLSVWTGMLERAGMRFWKRSALGVPTGTVLMVQKGKSFRYGPVALLIPRQSGLQVVVTYPNRAPTYLKGPERAWMASTLKQLPISSVPFQRSKARDYFLKEQTAAFTLYAHGERMMRLAVALGMLETVLALSAATEDMKVRLLAKYTSLSLLPKLLLSSPIADAEDVAVSVHFRPHLTFDVVHSLTSAGQKAMKAASRRANTHIPTVYKGKTSFPVDISLQVDARKYLKHLIAPLPWIQGWKAFYGKRPSTQTFMLAFTSGKLMKPILLTQGGGYVLKGLLSLGSRRGTRTPIPSRGRLVMLRAKGASSLPRLAAAIVLPKASRKFVGQLVTGLKKYVRHFKWNVRRRISVQGGQLCLLLGVNLSPRTVFRGCKATKMSSTLPLYHATFRARELLQLYKPQLASMHPFLRKRAEARFNRLRRWFPRVKLAAWVKQGVLVHRLQVCRRCRVHRPPTLPSLRGTPLPMPKTWPLRGAGRCALAAKVGLRAFYGVIEKGRKRPLRAFMRKYASKMKSLLRCMRRVPAYRKRAQTFASLWRAGVMYTKSHTFLKFVR